MRIELWSSRTGGSRRRERTRSCWSRPACMLASIGCRQHSGPTWSARRTKAVASDGNKPGSGIGRLCLWSLGHARRRWPALTGVLATMLLKAGLDVLKPWPMKVLIDQVISDQPMPPALAGVLDYLPYTATRDGLLWWCVAGTVVIFLLIWGLGLANSLLNI